MQLDATKFLCLIPAISCAQILATFSTFQLFRLFDLATAVAYFLPSIHLILYRPSLVASYAPSDAPEPLFTSDFHSRCRKHRCRHILTSGEEILASWNSAPGDPRCTCSSTTCQPRAMRIPIG